MVPAIGQAQDNLIGQPNVSSSDGPNISSSDGVRFSVAHMEEIFDNFNHANENGENMTSSSLTSSADSLGTVQSIENNIEALNLR